MSYIVFDCTKAVGVSCRLPSRRLAAFASDLLTFLTGRYHDWLPDVAPL
jgi:hypothetical protein